MMILVWIGLVLTGTARGEPRSDATTLLAERWFRLYGGSTVLGGSDDSLLHQGWQLGNTVDPDSENPEAQTLGREFEPELLAARGSRSFKEPAFRFSPGGRLAFGTQAPANLAGDAEPGLGSVRAWLGGRVYPDIFEVSLEPEGRFDAGEGIYDIDFALRDAWLGVHSAHWSGGLGLRERWLGPGRRGSLVLTNNADTAPHLAGAWHGPVWSLGHGRIEAGGGWLDRPRTDVSAPGWLFFDARWAPISLVEFGLSRASIFGGQDRPLPDPFQLLLPTQPHVYDDPNQVQPDQDELAALDLRVLLPIAMWSGRRPVSRGLVAPQYIELWWQYGGEDVIARDRLGIPLPTLAGVANLGGAEVNLGAWSLSVEGTRLLDDTFRWYTGHRVYHQGWTQDGRSMGHHIGGDATSLWGALTWLQAKGGAELWAERIRRVGIIDAEGPHLFALSQTERRHALGGRGWLLHPQFGWWKLEASIERIEGAQFVPGNDGWAWRVGLGR